MNREQIIQKLRDYFEVQELVGELTFNMLGSESWQVFDTDTLHCLLIIREGINLPMIVNNWHKGGKFDERGYRSNLQYIAKNKTLSGVLYISGHVLGKAIDFVVVGMDAEDVRTWIEDNADLFPCKIRLEWCMNGKPITWVHYDTKQVPKLPKVYKFNV